jgi:NhaA family Na+:H+ antiporter
MFRDKHHEPPALEQSSQLAHFLKQDVFAAALLLVSALAALLTVNLGWEDAYHHLLETQWGVSLWNGSFIRPLHFWINDGLMAVFFFLVGLEIKRELLAGELASIRKATLPAFAAVGGMLCPALIYTALNFGSEARVGWGIPMATDIAFAIGCMSLLGKRVPVGLSVFLIALAIVDDLGSVLVIAVFYTERIAFESLIIGGALIGLSYILGRLGVRATLVYLLIWIGIWLAFLESGVHATIAGVLVAFTIPINARYETPLFHGRMKTLLERFVDAEDHVNPLLVNSRQQELIGAILTECRHVEAPLQRIEHSLHPVTMLIIMPLFAFANSGIHIDWSALLQGLAEPVLLGVALGLILGKQIGIVLFSWLAVRLRLAELPDGVTWSQVYGMSWTAGIGFTMSLFISQLAFPDAPEHLVQAKMGIFLASIVGGTVGYVLLRRTCAKSV